MGRGTDANELERAARHRVLPPPDPGSRVRRTPNRRDHWRRGDGSADPTRDPGAPSTAAVPGTRSRRPVQHSAVELNLPFAVH